MGQVVVEGFGSLYALGLRQLLPRDEIELCSSGSDGLLARLRRAVPDVVLLNSALVSTAALVRTIVTDFPGTTVITCSTAGAEMEVYPPFHGGESFRCPLDELDRQVHS